jgi:hypothetical protein
MTYQAASGAGRAAHARARAQMGEAHAAPPRCSTIPASAILDIDRAVTESILRARAFRSESIRLSARRQPAALDRQGPGQRPEPRGVEGRRRDQQDPRPQQRQRRSRWTASACASARCAATARRSPSSCAATVPLDEIEGMLADAHDWVKVVPNRARKRWRSSRRRRSPARWRCRSAACASCPWAGLPGGVHRRRPAAVGRRRAAAPHAADPLNAEIEIVALQSRRRRRLVARVAPLDAFTAAGIEPTAMLNTMRFAVERRGNQRILRMTTTAPVNEPFVELLIELQWSGGRLVREYTFLLDPPEYKSRRRSPRHRSLPRRRRQRLLRKPPSRRRRSKPSRSSPAPSACCTGHRPGARAVRQRCHRSRTFRRRAFRAPEAPAQEPQKEAAAEPAKEPPRKRRQARRAPRRHA